MPERLTKAATVTIRLVDDGTDWDAHMMRFAFENAANFVESFPDLAAGDLVTYDDHGLYVARYRWTTGGNLVCVCRDKRVTPPVIEEPAQ